MIRAFIFDMDGLLVETESVQLAAFEIFMRGHGIEPAEGYVEGFVGFSIKNNVERVKRELGLEGDTDALVTERNDIYLEMLSGEDIHPLPGVAALFDFAEAHGLKVGVCSSSDRPQLDLVLPRLLEAVGRPAEPEEFFDTIVCGSDVEHVKPAPDIYIECAGALGIKPCECLAFEDSTAGATSAAAAGAALVVVPNEYSRDVAVWPTEHVAASLQDVLDGGLLAVAPEGVGLAPAAAGREPRDA